MKKFLFLSMLLFVGFLFADSNTTKETIPLTMDHISAIGSILEPSTEILASQIESFGTNLTIFVSVIVTLISVFGYLGFLKPMSERSKKMEEKIEAEFAKTEEKIEKKFAQIQKTVSDEVKKQIIYSTDGQLDKARVYAQERINVEIKKTTQKANEKLFAYQELVYEVKSRLLQQSDDIFSQENLSQSQMLQEFISLQYKHNEIINHDLPLLFSDNITNVKQVAKLLSEHQEIKNVILVYLSGFLKENRWSESEKEEIKKVLFDYYQYTC